MFKGYTKVLQNKKSIIESFKTIPSIRIKIFGSKCPIADNDKINKDINGDSIIILISRLKTAKRKARNKKLLKNKTNF